MRRAPRHSEPLVRSGHSVQSHPLAIVDVRRILRSYAAALDGEKRDPSKEGEGPSPPEDVYRVGRGRDTVSEAVVVDPIDSGTYDHVESAHLPSTGESPNHMPPSVSDSGVVLPELQLKGTDLVRLSVKQYHDLARAGILAEDNQVELLEGLLVRKVTKNRAHSLSTRKARELLERVIPAGAYVDSQEPITTLESEPEPDGIVVKGRPEDYPDRHPAPNEVFIVIEVADASLPRDRAWKLRIYARAAVAVYWILNLVERQVEVYSGPTGPADTPGYTVKAVFKPGDEVPVVLAGREVGRVAVVDLLA